MGKMKRVDREGVGDNNGFYEMTAEAGKTDQDSNSWLNLLLSCKINYSAVDKALAAHDSGLWTHGGTDRKTLIDAIVYAALSRLTHG